MPYARRIRRRTAKKPVRKQRSAATKNLTFGQSSRSTATKRNPAFSRNLGSALHIDSLKIGGNTFPASMWTKHRYCQQVTLAADNLTGRTGSEVAFRLNGLFDPDFTGVGHQPLGFDQMTPLYSLYRVYKVDINVRLTGRYGSGAQFLAINIRPNGAVYNMSGLKNAQEIMEQPANTIMDGALNQSWEQTVYIADIEGCPRQQVLTDTNYAAGVTSFPNRVPYLSVVCGTYDEPASSSNGVYAMVSFVYHTLWTNVNPLNGS